MHLIKIAFLLVSCLSFTHGYEDSPDIRLLSGVGKYIWENKDDLLDELLDGLMFDEEDRQDFLQELNEDVGAPEERISCAQCRVSQLLVFCSIKSNWNLYDSV